MTPDNPSAVEWSLNVALRCRVGALTVDLKRNSIAPALALVGPSGSGKTTTLRMLAGLTRSTEGYTYVRGTPWYDSASNIWRHPWQRQVGWVPQEALLFPHLTVSQQLHYAASKSTHAIEIIRLTELSPLLSRYPRHLSGGERQRVALGRALMRMPDLLLLDEPFSALDRERRERLMLSLREFCQVHKIGYVLVSHDERDVAALADEVWELRDGRLR